MAPYPKQYSKNSPRPPILNLMDLICTPRAHTLEDLLILGRRAGISPADILGMAREISRNPLLLSLAELHPIWLDGLCKFVAVLGDPLRVPAAVVEMRRAA